MTLERAASLVGFAAAVLTLLVVLKHGKIA
jgi:hypothetical protein